jgi:flagellar biosynthesis/type III secretory pathway M-ring protein FliF/YscJ
MFNSSFRQQAAAWQQQFSQRQRGNIVQRVLAWLVLGVMLVIAAAILLFMLLLSWLVIPIVIYRYRKKMRRFTEAARQHAEQNQPQGGQHHEGSQRTSRDSRVIEGEVLHKDER